MLKRTVFTSKAAAAAFRSCVLKEQNQKNLLICYFAPNLPYTGTVLFILAACSRPEAGASSQKRNSLPRGIPRFCEASEVVPVLPLF